MTIIKKPRINHGEKLWKQKDLVRLLSLYDAEDVAAVFAAGGSEADIMADLDARRAASIKALRLEIAKLKAL